MASLAAKNIDDKITWEAYLDTHPEANFLHSWYWGEFHKRLNHVIIRIGFYRGETLVGVLLAIVEPARRGRHLIVPGGPILDWQYFNDEWTQTLRELAKEHECAFARVRPQLLDTTKNHQLFRKLGFIKAPMHLHAQLTSQLDLQADETDLVKAMRKGARYELNRVKKLAIEVAASTTNEFMDEFYDLQVATARRQNFVPFSKAFLQEQFAVFAEGGHAVMYRSTYEGKLVAMAFIIFYGAEAAYHYGASTELARKVPGAYAIQWEAISEARRRGCKRYNFWGVTEHGQTKHRFYGVSVFKRGFGGEDVAYLPARDLIVDKKRYLATYAFETARRKLRHL